MHCSLFRSTASSHCVRVGLNWHVKGRLAIKVSALRPALRPSRSFRQGFQLGSRPVERRSFRPLGAARRGSALTGLSAGAARALGGPGFLAPLLAQGGSATTGAATVPRPRHRYQPAAPRPSAAALPWLRRCGGSVGGAAPAADPGPAAQASAAGRRRGGRPPSASARRRPAAAGAARWSRRGSGKMGAPHPSFAAQHRPLAAAQ